MSSESSPWRWAVLILSMLMDMVTMGWIWLSLPVFLPIIAEELSLDAARAQFLFGSISVTFVLTAFAGGWIGERWSLRYVVAGGGALMALSTLVRAQNPSYTGGLVASLLVGVGLGLCIPNFVEVLARWFPARELGMANGVRMTGERLGAASAQGWIVPFLVTRTGGWRGAQLILGGIAAGLALIWGIVYRDPSRAGQRPAPNRSGPGPWKALKRVWTNRLLLIITTVALIHTFCVFAFMGLLPTWLRRRPFVLPGWEGTYSSVYFGCLLLSGLVIPWISDWLRRRRMVMIILMVMMAVGMAGTGLSRSSPQVLGTIVVSGLGAGAMIPLLFTLVSDPTGNQSRSAETGFLLSVSQVGAIVGPPFGGAVLEWGGVAWSSLAVSFPIVLSLILMFRIPGGFSGSGSEAGG